VNRVESSQVRGTVYIAVSGECDMKLIDYRSDPTNASPGGNVWLIDRMIVHHIGTIKEKKMHISIISTKVLGVLGTRDYPHKC